MSFPFDMRYSQSIYRQNIHEKLPKCKNVHNVLCPLKFELLLAQRYGRTQNMRSYPSFRKKATDFRLDEPVV